MELELKLSLKWIILSLLILAGSSYPESSYGRADGSKILIGAILDRNGPLKLLSSDVMRGLELAIEVANDKDGIKIGRKSYYLNLFIEDSRSSAYGAEKAAQRLIDDKGVDFLIAPPNSLGSLSAARVAAQRGALILLISPSIDDKPSRPSPNSNSIWHLPTLPERALIAPMELIAHNSSQLGSSNGQIKAILLHTEDFLAKRIVEGMSTRSHRMRITLALKKNLLPGEDLDQETQSLLDQSSANALFLVDPLRFLTGATQAVLNSNIPVRIVIGCPLLSDGDSVPWDNMLCIESWASDLNYRDPLFGSARAFFSLYRERYGELPGEGAAIAAAAITLYIDAFKRADSLSSERVGLALAASKVETLYGPVRFNQNGYNIDKPYVTRQVQEGKLITLTPSRWASGSLRLPP